MKVLPAKTDDARISFKIGKKKQKAHSTWFRGEHCNFNPYQPDLRSADAVWRHVLQGWLPPQPMIGLDTRISAFGSCFAEHISQWLSDRNFSLVTKKGGAFDQVYVVRYGEGMVNSFAIRQQFEWAFEGKVADGELWHGYNAESFGYDEGVRIQTKEVFDNTDVFVITLGLSEVWYDERSGGVFWRAIPRDKYDPARHKFRVASVEENKDNIREISRLIRRHRPDAKVIFTLSPIPLAATFRPVSCITANSVSKAILRAALDEVLREPEVGAHSFYWPSYEIVMDIFDRQWRDDRRHVKKPILDFIMTLFENYWCYGTTPRMSLDEAWARARASTGFLPQRLAVPLAGQWARHIGSRLGPRSADTRKDSVPGKAVCDVISKKPVK
jgi:hypothetical protein